jgi:hypothetical protein
MKISLPIPILLSNTAHIVIPSLCMYIQVFYSIIT